MLVEESCAGIGKISKKEMEVKEKIWRRAGHISFEYNDQFFMWGGFSEHLPKVS